MNDVIEHALQATGVVPQLATLARFEAEQAFELGGDVAAAQRLWSLTLAACEGRAYSDLVGGSPAVIKVLREVSARLRAFVLKEATPPLSSARPVQFRLRAAGPPTVTFHAVADPAGAMGPGQIMTMTAVRAVPAAIGE